MLFRFTDTARVQQSLIVVQVVDSITEKPPLNPATVKLFYQMPERPHPLIARQYANGQFVFVGNPASLFSELEQDDGSPNRSGDQLALTLQAEARGYQKPTSFDFTIDRAVLALEESAIEIEDLDLSFNTSHSNNAPVIRHTFSLAPIPPVLSGRVVDLDGEDQPIGNAEIRVIAPQAGEGVLTDAQGFFTLSDLPVTATVTVEITHEDFSDFEEEITLNYRESVNQKLFRLESI